MAQAPIGKADRTRLDRALPELCRLLRAGNFLKTACGVLRVDQYRAHARILLAATDKAQPSDIKWALAIAEARQLAVADLVAEIRDAQFPNREGGTDWKARAWLLERLDPKSFGEAAIRKAVESTDGDAAAETDRSVVVMPPAALVAKEAAERLAALQAEIDRLKAENAKLAAAKAP